MSKEQIYASEYLSKRAKQVVLESLKCLPEDQAREFAEDALNDAEMASCNDREYTDYLRSMME